MSTEPSEVVATQADALAAAVLACPLVAGLHGGAHGHVATYLPGRRVAGIVLTPQQVRVHVTGRYPATMTEIADQVRAAATPHAAGLPVWVTIEDLALGAVAGTTATPLE